METIEVTLLDFDKPNRNGRLYNKNVDHTNSIEVKNENKKISNDFSFGIRKIGNKIISCDILPNKEGLIWKKKCF